MGINLSRTSAAARAQQRKDRMFTQGMWIAIAILLVVAGAYAGLRVYNSTLEGNISAVDNKINLVEAEISGPRVVEIANAIFRVQDIEKNYVPDSIVLSFLEAVSDAMVDVVNIDTYSYSAEDQSITVKADMSTQDLLAVARQIESFKQAGIFHAVSVENVSRDSETGEVGFTAVLVYNFDSITLTERKKQNN